MSAGNEKDIAGPDGTPPTGRWRGLRIVLIACGGFVVMFAAFWFDRASRDRGFTSQSSQSAPPRASQISVAPRITELTNEAAAKLLSETFAQRPIVARLALGDVATIDQKGAAVPLYPALVQAQIVRLRFCRFPGAGGGANQICLADLADKAQPYVYGGGNPLRSVAAAADDLHPENRRFAQLMLAVPRLDEIGQISDRRRGEKVIVYTAHFELTPLASSFGISGENFPKSIAGTAEIRLGSSGWTVENDGLLQTEGKAN